MHSGKCAYKNSLSLQMYVTNHYNSLILSCLERDPNKRPSGKSLTYYGYVNFAVSQPLHRSMN
jgi:hypothetical protein